MRYVSDASDTSNVNIINNVSRVGNLVVAIVVALVVALVVVGPELHQSNLD